ncbi:MAG: hypothetical protein ACI8RZ_003969 [Myxococcota bacterium]|jgi:hypothetical protein
MKAFETTTTIRAPASTVWAILTDAAKYPEWNSTVTRVDGTIALDSKITVHAKISPDRAFPVSVATLEADRKMVWSSGMPLGLFKGERIFTLTEQDGAVTFFMREEFTGLLSGLIGRTIPDLQPVFEDFAADLKRTAEGAS